MKKQRKQYHIILPDESNENGPIADMSKRHPNADEEFFFIRLLIILTMFGPQIVI